MGKLRSAIGYSIVGSVFVGACNFFTQIYFARRLGVEIISEYAQIFIIVQLVFLSLSFGTNHAVIILGSKENYIRAGWILQLGVCLFAIIIFFTGLSSVNLFAPQLVGADSKLAAISFLGSLFVLPAYIFNIEFESTLRYREISAVRSVSFLVANAIGASMCWAGYGLKSIVFKDFSFGLTYLCLSIVIASPKFRHMLFVTPFKRVTREDLIAVTKISWKNYLLNLGSAGVARIDYWIVGFSLGHLGLGVYYQMRSLVDGVLAIFLGSIQSTVFSFFVLERDTINWKKLVYEIFCIGMVLALTAAALAALFGDFVVQNLFGASWRAGAPFLVGLGAYSVLRGTFETLVSMAKSQKIQPIIVTGQIVWGAGLLILIPILASRYGNLGAGIGVAVAAGVAVVLVSLRITKHFDRLYLSSK